MGSSLGKTVTHKKGKGGEWGGGKISKSQIWRARWRNVDAVTFQPVSEREFFPKKK